MPLKTRMSAADRREQLLDSVRQIVAEHGFHAVSIEAVARAAGVSRPIVYGHFHDLPGLLDALVLRESGRALEQLEAIMAPYAGEGDRREAMLASLSAYLESVRADPSTWRLVLMPPEGAPVSLRERIAEGRTAVVAQLAQGIGAGLPESPDPELTARMLSALSDEAARLVLTEPEEYDVERILRQARWVISSL